MLGKNRFPIWAYPDDLDASCSPLIVNFQVRNHMQDQDYQSLMGNQVIQTITYLVRLSSLLLQASLASLLELHTALLHLVQQQPSDATQQRTKQDQRPTDKERLAWMAAFRPHGAGLLSPIRPRSPEREYRV